MKPQPVPEKKDEYVFHPPVNSWLYDEVLSPHIYNHLVKLYPMWLHPNVITIWGGLAAFTGLWLVYTSSFSLEGGADNITYTKMALCFALYCIFDNTDGKQARRTKTSSKVGEMLDHGVDTCVTTVSTIMTADAMRLSPTATITYTLLIQMAMFFNNWYHTVTGVMSLGGRYLSVDEGMLTVIAMLATAGYFGPGVYHAPVGDGALDFSETSLPPVAAGAVKTLFPNVCSSGGENKCSPTVAFIVISTAFTGLGYDIAKKFVLGLVHAHRKGEFKDRFIDLCPLLVYTFCFVHAVASTIPGPELLLPFLILSGGAFSGCGIRLVVIRTAKINRVMVVQLGVMLLTLLVWVYATQTYIAGEASPGLLTKCGVATGVFVFVGFSDTVVQTAEGGALFTIVPKKD